VPRQHRTGNERGYPEQYKEVTAADAERLVDGLDVAQAVVDFTYRVCSVFVSAVSFRLQLVAVPTIDGDDALRGALAGKYHRGLRTWSQVYAEFIEARVELGQPIPADHLPGGSG
jgi:hypothetical protein